MINLRSILPNHTFERYWLRHLSTKIIITIPRKIAKLSCSRLTKIVIAWEVTLYSYSTRMWQTISFLPRRGTSGQIGDRNLQFFIFFFYLSFRKWIQFICWKFTYLCSICRVTNWHCLFKEQSNLITFMLAI